MATTPRLSVTPDDLRYGSALLVALGGLLIAAVLACVLAIQTTWKASDVTALMGTFTTIIGTLVGAFLGVQVGAAGKQKSDHLAHKALAALPPEEAVRVLSDE
jgi:hypothetical protein